MDNVRDFKGIWIPKEIWLSNDLGWSAKLLLVEIDSFATNNECFASNDFFSKRFNLSKDRISKLISELKAKGYIETKIIYKEGSKQIDKRVITTYGYKKKKAKMLLNEVSKNTDTPIGENTDTPIGENTYTSIGKNTDTPIGENAEDNNTYINNTINNTSSSKDKNSTATTTNDINLLNVFEKLGFGTINYRIVTDLSILEKEFTSQWVKEAMEESVTSGVRNLKYVRSILQRWKAQGKPKDTSILSKENKKPVENRYGEAPKYEPVTDEYIEKIKEKSLKKLREQAKGQQQENTSKPKNLDELLKKIKL